MKLLILMLLVSCSDPSYERGKKLKALIQREHIKLNFSYYHKKTIDNISACSYSSGNTAHMIPCEFFEALKGKINGN